MYRKLLSWEWYTESEMVHLFIHCVLKANFKSKIWRGVEVKRGQFITGLDVLSNETGISVQTLRTCLRRMEGKELASRSTNKYRVITVINYEAYQTDQQASQQASQQATNKQPTSNQQATNSNEEEEEREEVKECKESFKKEVGVDVVDHLPAILKKSPFLDESLKFSKWFEDSLCPKTITPTNKDRANWAYQWNLLRAEDGRDDVKEICAAIKWAREDQFWSTNFLTPMKLRRKDKNGQMFIDRFIAESQKQHKPHSNGRQRKGDSTDTWNAEFTALENRLQGTGSSDIQVLP